MLTDRVTTARSTASLCNETNAEPSPDQCENCHSGAQYLRRFPIKGAATFWHCEQCGLYQKGLPFSPVTQALEGHEHYLLARPRKLRTAAERLAQLRPYVIRRSPRLLDIGCSIGATVEMANQIGWRGFGIDVNRGVVAFCHERGLHCQHYDGLRLPYPSMFFHVVTAWHVIEHVPSVRLALEEWRRVLHPQGVLAIETPAADCWKARVLGPAYRKFWNVEHTYTFTRKNLTSILVDCGFEILGPCLRDVACWSSPAGLLRRTQLGVTRLIGASKSFVLYARRA